jgi:hypothetical protein
MVRKIFFLALVCLAPLPSSADFYVVPEPVKVTSYVAPKGPEYQQVGLTAAKDQQSQTIDYLKLILGDKEIAVPREATTRYKNPDLSSLELRYSSSGSGHYYIYMEYYPAGLDSMSSTVFAFTSEAYVRAID